MRNFLMMALLLVSLPLMATNYEKPKGNGHGHDHEQDQEAITTDANSVSDANSESHSQAQSDSFSDSHSDSASESDSSATNAANNTASQILNVTTEYEAVSASAADLNLAYCTDGMSGQGTGGGGSVAQLNYICETDMAIKLLL